MQVVSVNAGLPRSDVEGSACKQRDFQDAGRGLDCGPQAESGR